MNFLCPACRTPLPKSGGDGVVPCTRCGVQVDLTRLDTAPGTARLWPDLDLAGESLGPYRLTKRLAAGGMGVVYEAEGPGGPCAVKVLSALLAAEPELRTRFRREAAALRAIEHAGVVRILEEGEERGFCWYAMERVPGPDLRTRIAEGPLDAAEVESLARRLLETLAEVHGRGFVHRDIKPGNILLAPTGPKLCDFGIARFDGSSTLTESAAVLGSLRYMAPEQRLGRTDARSDLYALGIVLHEALAKGVPGEATLPGGVPGRLRRLIARLLAERPLERPADARAALAELDRKLTRPVAAALGATAAAAASAGIAWLLAAPTVETPRNLLEKQQNLAVPAAAKQPKPAEPRQPQQQEAQRQNLLGNADLPQEVLQNVGLAPQNAAPNDVKQAADDPAYPVAKPTAQALQAKEPGLPLGTKGEPPPKGRMTSKAEAAQLDEVRVKKAPQRIAGKPSPKEREANLPEAASPSEKELLIKKKKLLDSTGAKEQGVPAPGVEDPKAANQAALEEQVPLEAASKKAPSKKMRTDATGD